MKEQFRRFKKYNVRFIPISFMASGMLKACRKYDVLQYVSKHEKTLRKINFNTWIVIIIQIFQPNSN